MAAHRYFIIAFLISLTYYFLPFYSPGLTPFHSHGENFNDENFESYMSKVRNCITQFMSNPEKETFEVTWNKIPNHLKGCSHNKNFNLLQFTTKQDLTLYKIPNVLEEERKCEAVIMLLDGDTTITDLNLEKSIPNCNFTKLTFVNQPSAFMMNSLNDIKTTIDFLVISPSQSTSVTLLEQFLKNNEPFFPTICQVNLAYNRPIIGGPIKKAMKKFQTNSNFLMIEGSKDIKHTSLNLFFINTKSEYCRNRYLKTL